LFIFSPTGQELHTIYGGPRCTWTFTERTQVLASLGGNRHQCMYELYVCHLSILSADSNHQKSCLERLLFTL